LEQSALAAKPPGLLLDTHVLIWSIVSPGKLSHRVREALEVAEADAFVSAASIMEMEIKARAGRLTELAVMRARFDQEIESYDYRPLPITLRHARLAGSMPGDHKDPFDRLITAQALLEDLTLLSIDDALDQFGIRRLW
jgi:PIN domain nuclease of toxin-antitoxin system